MKKYHHYKLGVFVALTLMASCGLFDPSRTAEQPPPVLINSDLLNFSGLFRNASPAIVSVNYEGLFADSLLYQQGSQLIQEKNRMIEHFKTIEAKQPSIDVEWQYAKGASFMVTGVTNLDSVCYTVYLQGKNSGTGPEYTGYCNFTIYYNTIISDWQIASWTDVPANPVENNSFFNPYFTFPP
jgi:hypothetical protein